MAVSHTPLKILKARLRRLEHIIARRQALGHRQPKNKIPLHELERREARLRRIVEKRS